MEFLKVYKSQFQLQKPRIIALMICLAKNSLQNTRALDLMLESCEFIITCQEYVIIYWYIYKIWRRTIFWKNVLFCFLVISL